MKHKWTPEAWKQIPRIAKNNSEKNSAKKLGKEETTEIYEHNTHSTRYILKPF